jgi:ubiquinone/menaquinone biosynthesis C-methylase UbiE
MTTSAALSTPVLSPQHAYTLWASTYDETPNPLLALEERRLAPLLKNHTDNRIVELGCGTGRWLHRLQELAPRSLIGIDQSVAMLARARKKCLASTALIQADCEATPLPARSADCVLASFLLSYVAQISDFAAEVARILRSGGTLVVSDLHPDAAAYGWRRTFTSLGRRFEIATHPYTLFDLIVELRTAGLHLEQIHEPCFGREEEEIFRNNGMLDKFRDVESLPVIYWAQFTRRES